MGPEVLAALLVQKMDRVGVGRLVLAVSLVAVVQIRMHPLDCLTVVVDSVAFPAGTVAVVAGAAAVAALIAVKMLEMVAVDARLAKSVAEETASGL